MKKLIAALVALVMCLSLVACGGAPDVQPAIDAYNELAQNYNAFVDQENENLDAWSEEDIEFMNGCADVITEYGNKLESQTEFTQEEIDEMVDMFAEFNGIIAEYMAESEG